MKPRPYVIAVLILALLPSMVVSQPDNTPADSPNTGWQALFKSMADESDHALKVWHQGKIVWQRSLSDNNPRQSVYLVYEAERRAKAPDE